MSRSVTVPDFGDSGSLYQQVEVAEPGEPGYPTPELPEGDPWAPAVNAAIREVAAKADLCEGLEPELEAGQAFEISDPEPGPEPEVKI
jgi:hypothetical protein